MRELRITIPGDPVAQGRPRSMVRNGKIVVYSTKRSAQWRKMAKQCFSLACQKPFLGTISVGVNAIFKTPKAKRNLAGHFKESKPDVDNLLKAVLDAGNDTLWLDDAQVVSASVVKSYAMPDCQACVEVYVSEVS